MIHIRGSDGGWQNACFIHTPAFKKQKHDEDLLTRYGPINGPKEIQRKQEEAKLDEIEKEIERAIQQTIDTYQ